MDAQECQTLIVAARDAVGKSTSQICDDMDRVGETFRTAVPEKFGSKK